MTNIIITAIVVSVVWIVILHKIGAYNIAVSEQEYESLKKSCNEKIERERKRHDEFEEQHEQEWREGRKENIIRSMQELFVMFLLGYTGAGVHEVKALFKAVRDAMHFASSVTYTGFDGNFNAVMLDDNELFEHLREKFPKLFKDFSLKDFYTKEENKERERGVIDREEDDEWDIVKKLTAKYKV